MAEHMEAIMGDLLAAACISFALQRENWEAFRVHMVTTHAAHQLTGKIRYTVSQVDRRAVIGAFGG